jgi:hypothetical protein
MPGANLCARALPSLRQFMVARAALMGYLIREDDGLISDDMARDLQLLDCSQTTCPDLELVMTVTPSNGQVVIAVTGNANLDSSYTWSMTCAEIPGFSGTGTGDSISVTHNGATNGTTYHYTCKVSKSGCGDQSVTGAGTPSDTPGECSVSAVISYDPATKIITITHSKIMAGMNIGVTVMYAPTYAHAEWYDSNGGHVYPIGPPNTSLDHFGGVVSYDMVAVSTQAGTATMALGTIAQIPGLCLFIDLSTPQVICTYGDGLYPGWNTLQIYTPFISGYGPKYRSLIGSVVNTDILWCTNAKEIVFEVMEVGGTTWVQLDAVARTTTFGQAMGRTILPNVPPTSNAFVNYAYTLVGSKFPAGGVSAGKLAKSYYVRAYGNGTNGIRGPYGAHFMIGVGTPVT